LSRINWSSVQPGDTILLDGGPVACPALGAGYNCGVVYHTTLDIYASGNSNAPITIRLADEPGRNGTVIIDGGLTQWSQCSEYAPEPAPPTASTGSTRTVGIDVHEAQWVVIDGARWGGIEVRNHTRYGLNFAGGQHVVARYLKLHHNTDPVDDTNGAVGVTQNYRSQYNTLARSEIFRNGQDAVRGAGDYFTMEESYLHDHYCNHPDGIQVFVPTGNGDVPDDAGEVRGLTVQRNVFERIGLQAVFLGENSAVHNSWSVDVNVNNNLFIQGAYMVKSKHGLSTNWRVNNNSFIGASGLAVEWCCANPGASVPMEVSNNIIAFTGEGRSAVYLPTGSGPTVFSGNCVFRSGQMSGDLAESGTIQADPGFANSGSANFALSGGSPCSGRGANVASLADLLAQTGATSAFPSGPYWVFFPVMGSR
jgi:hypothetical protein